MRNWGFQPCTVTSLHQNDVSWNAQLYFLMQLRKCSESFERSKKSFCSSSGKGGKLSKVTFPSLQQNPRLSGWKVKAFAIPIHLSYAWLSCETARVVPKCLRSIRMCRSFGRSIRVWVSCSGIEMNIQVPMLSFRFSRGKLFY